MSKPSGLSVKAIYGGALTPVKRVVQLLTKETSAKRVADFAKAVEAARMIDSQNLERRNYWGELAIWSRRRLGELIQQGQEAGVIAKRGGDRKSKPHDGALILREVLDTDTDKQARHISERAQKIAALPEDTIREYVRSHGTTVWGFEYGGEDTGPVGVAGIDYGAYAYALVGDV